MKLTKIETLNRYIQNFHALTFNFEQKMWEFDVWKHRKEFVRDKWILAVKRLRAAFNLYLFKNKEAREEFFRYMKESGDYICFVNYDVSAPDQRKFNREFMEKGGLKDVNLPFTLFWYQVVLAELARRKRVAGVKPRDIGASFTIYTLLYQQTLLYNNIEWTITSEKSEKVDKKGDMTQTAFGRIRNLFKKSRWFHIDDKNTSQNIVKNLYLREESGITGYATTPTALDQLRGSYAFFDEGGLVRDMLTMWDRATQSVPNCICFGTLNPQTDAQFRELVKSGYKVSLRPLWDKFREYYHEGDLSYKEIWDKIVDEIDVQEGETLQIQFKYDDQPLKSKCDAYLIESRGLGFRKDKIDALLDGNIDAASPERSLFNIEDHRWFFKNIKDVENMGGYVENMSLLAGFDPGGKAHKGIERCVLIPVFKDNYGFCYVMEPEIYTRGTRQSFAKEVARKYSLKYRKPMKIKADMATKVGESEGYGWKTEVFESRKEMLNGYPLFSFFTVKMIPNQNPSKMIDTINDALHETQFRYNAKTGKMQPLVMFHKKNEFWVNKADLTEKRTGNQENYRLCHYLDSFMYFAYDYLKNFVDLPSYDAGEVL